MTNKEKMEFAKVKAEKYDNININFHFYFKWHHLTLTILFIHVSFKSIFIYLKLATFWKQHHANYSWYTRRPIIYVCHPISYHQLLCCSNVFQSWWTLAMSWNCSFWCIWIWISNMGMVPWLESQILFICCCHLIHL